MPLWCSMSLFVEVAAGVAQFVGVRPGERHVAHAETVVVAQHADVALNGVAALDAHQRGQLVLAVRGEDVLGAEGHHHLVGMQTGLLVHRVDHVERALDFLALELLGIDPDGEELGAKVAGLDLVEVHVAVAGVLREVEVLVHKAAGRVGVGVDDEGGVVDGLPASGDAIGRNGDGLRLRFRRRCASVRRFGQRRAVESRTARARTRGIRGHVEEWAPTKNELRLDCK